MKNVMTIFKYTLLEVLRSKLMIIIPIVSCSILFMSYLASTFAYGAPERIAIDIGLGLMSLSNLAISIFVGATLVSKEVESKTIYMIVSKPISRTAFLLGKLIGLGVVVVINVIVQSFVCAWLYYHFKSEIPVLLIAIGLLSLYESVIVMLITITFSLSINISLTIIFTILTWIISNVLAETQKILFLKNSEYLNSILSVVAKFVPDFSRFNVKDFILYHQVLPEGYVVKTSIYFLFYSVAIFLLADVLFKRKDLS